MNKASSNTKNKTAGKTASGQLALNLKEKMSQEEVHSTGKVISIQAASEREKKKLLKDIIENTKSF